MLAQPRYGPGRELAVPVMSQRRYEYLTALDVIAAAVLIVILALVLA